MESFCFTFHWQRYCCCLLIHLIYCITMMRFIYTLYCVDSHFVLLAWMLFALTDFLFELFAMMILRLVTKRNADLTWYIIEKNIIYKTVTCFMLHFAVATNEYSEPEWKRKSIESSCNYKVNSNLLFCKRIKAIYWCRLNCHSISFFKLIAKSFSAYKVFNVQIVWRFAEEKTKSAIL